eukprot:scaffold189505_cov29-Tisochrysis_lutea.AAC.5
MEAGAADLVGGHGKEGRERTGPREDVGTTGGCSIRQAQEGAAEGSPRRCGRKGRPTQTRSIDMDERSGGGWGGRVGEGPAGFCARASLLHLAERGGAESFVRCCSASVTACGGRKRGGSAAGRASMLGWSGRWKRARGRIAQSRAQGGGGALGGSTGKRAARCEAGPVSGLATRSTGRGGSVGARTFLGGISRWEDTEIATRAWEAAARVATSDRADRNQPGAADGRMARLDHDRLWGK